MSFLSKILGWVAPAESLHRLPGVTAQVGRLDAASTSGRGRYWRGVSAGINSVVETNAPTVRERVREQILQNPFARRALVMTASNMVGTGIRPVFRFNDDNLKKQILEMFEDFATYSDTNEATNYYGQQMIATKGLISSGESFIRFRYRRADSDLPVPLQLQLIPSAQLPLDKNMILPNGGCIKNGIEFDRLQKRVAYHFYRDHPGEWSRDYRSIQTVRVPASEVIHLFVPEEEGQIRGYPWFAQTLVRMRKLDIYEDAEMDRITNSTASAGFVTKAQGDAPSAEDFFDDNEMRAEAIAEIESGTIRFLNAGEDIKFADASDVGDNYEAFIKTQMQAIAVGTHNTTQAISGDLSDVNHSSGRLGEIHTRRILRPLIQHYIIPKVCARVFEEVLTVAVMSGRISIPDYATNRRKYMRAVGWVAAGWEYVNPVDDVKAERDSIRAGLTSRSAVVAARGLDAEKLDEEIAADNARADRLGLVFDSDARQTAASGQVQPDIANPDLNQGA